MIYPHGFEMAPQYPPNVFVQEQLPQYINYDPYYMPQFIPTPEHMHSTIICPQDQIIKCYPPLQFPKKVFVKEEEKKDRKRFYHLDNNPYLNGSHGSRNFAQQPTFQQLQETLQPQILFQTQRNDQVYTPSQPQQQIQQPQGITASQSQQNLQQSIQQQSVNEQVEQQLYHTQRQPIQNQNILEQRNYQIQSQSLPNQQSTIINSQQPLAQSQFDNTAQFQPLLTKTLNSQSQRQKQQIVQSTIHYNGPKQRPGLSLDIKTYQTSSQSQSQSRLKRSKIFD